VKVRGGIAPRDAPQARVHRPPRGYPAGWLNLGWKVLLALVIILLISVDSPVSRALAWSFVNPIRATLLVWGAAVVLVASGNLSVAPTHLKWAWTALAAGAYAAVAIPAVVAGTPRMLDALGPVVALTLLAHLGRRDLPGALRDWALIVALTLYMGLGVAAMLLVVRSFGELGPTVFLAVVLLPPLIYEAAVLALRRAGALKPEVPIHLIALLPAVAPAVLLSMRFLNPATPLEFALAFNVLVALLVAGALLLAWITHPLVEAAATAHRPEATRPTSVSLGRSLVELTHGPVLIALALYLPLSLITTGVVGS
jgi:hypothetical protein